MKFMGAEEAGCRQSGDYAIPQPGDIKSIDPRIQHAGTYGRKDIVHFQFYLAEEGKDGVGEKKCQTKRARESADAGKQPQASSNDGSAAKRLRSMRGQ
eukprot:g57541.t1